MTTATAPKEHCPKCGGTEYYFRRKTNDYACKTCPATWSAKPLRA